MNIFERASRMNLMIGTHRGIVSVNQLWNMDADELVTLGNKIYKELPTDEDIFGRGVKQEVNQGDRLRFDIIKHIIKAKDDAVKSAIEKAQDRTVKERVRSLLERKEEAQLEAEIEKMTPEEIKEKYGL